jgi:hypothetical protein
LRELLLTNPPQTLKVGDPIWLSGHGFSPNCADMEVRLYWSGKSESQPVLAATEDQLKLAPFTEIKPGAAELKVINQATHQNAPSQPLLFYDLDAHLEQHTLKKGQQTTLVLYSQPVDFRMKVHVMISGQATFNGGSTTADVMIDNGRVSIPILADRGAGPFHIEYEGQPAQPPHFAGCSCGCGGTAQPACAHKGCSCAKTSAASTQSPEYAGCTCGCGGTAQPACAHKGCACSKALETSAIAGCSCGCGGTAQPACAHKNCACANAAEAVEVLTTLQHRLDNVSQLVDKPTGKAGCKCGCGGTAQPRCVQKECGCGK